MPPPPRPRRPVNPPPPPTIDVTPAPYGLGTGERVGPRLIPTPAPTPAEQQRMQEERDYQQQRGGAQRPLSPEERRELRQYRRQFDQNPQGRQFNPRGTAPPAQTPEAAPDTAGLPEGHPDRFSMLGSATMGAASDVTLGTWDNIAAYVAAAMGKDPIFGYELPSDDFGERREMAHKLYEQLDKQAYEDNWKSYIAGGLAGSAVPGGLLFKGARAAGNAARIANLTKGKTAAQIAEIKAALAKGRAPITELVGGQAVNAANKAARLATKAASYKPAAAAGAIAGAATTPEDADWLTTGSNAGIGALTQGFFGPNVESGLSRFGDMVGRNWVPGLEYFRSTRLGNSMGAIQANVKELGGSERAAQIAREAADRKLFRVVKDMGGSTYQAMEPRVAQLLQDSGEAVGRLTQGTTVDIYDVAHRLFPAIHAAYPHRGNDARYEVLEGIMSALRNLEQQNIAAGRTPHIVPSIEIDAIEHGLIDKIRGFNLSKSTIERFQKEVLGQLIDVQEQAVAKRWGAQGLAQFRKAKHDYGLARDLGKMLEAGRQRNWNQYVGGLSGVMGLTTAASGLASGAFGLPGAIISALIGRIGGMPRVQYGAGSLLKYGAQAIEKGQGLGLATGATQPFFFGHHKRTTEERGNSPLFGGGLPRRALEQR